MDFKLIKGTEHRLYDDLKEFKAFGPPIDVKCDWRHGFEGEWVYTDDEHICQILRKTKISHPSYKEKRTLVRTVCGSFIVEQKSHKILGENGIAENIYAFSGNLDSLKDFNKKRKGNPREFLFAQFVAKGFDVERAYRKAYPNSTSETHIKRKSRELLQKKSVKNMVKEEIKKILEEEGVTAEYVIGRYKDIADLSENDSNRLRSLDALGKMLGLFETEKKEIQATFFKGFNDEQIEAISGGKTELIAHKEKEIK